MKGLITSCFGLGWLPIAPGTWGSLPPALLFALMGGMGCAPISLQIAMVILVVLGSVTCVAWSPSAIARTGKKDPGEVVMDEVAGQALCFLVLLMIPAVALSARQMVIAGGAGFFLFRIFDVFKVWPGKRLERLRDG
ncbi:MAG: phosphatidylglycerophosphatase A, partial [Planctomycetes bacterium]|nr:phosphatidylglycerophosphatase A [Planctomycetota bacterium]